MTKLFQYRFYALLLLIFTVFSAQAKMLETRDFTPLSPDKEQMKTNALITYQLQRYHYRNLPLEDTVAEQVFDNYLDALDNQKLYFIASDIKEFEPYRRELNKALSTGQLDPAFRIYNRYQRRVIERLEYSLSLLDKGIDQFDFGKDEELLIDREPEHWIKSEEELDDLWRRRVKGAVLSLKLSGKEPKEIAKTLKKRYESQLNRVLQANSEDAFQTYMNAFTGVYDPHTQYFSPRTSENFNINMSLSLEGIGAVLQTDNEFTKVVRLVPAGPADKQGELRPADRIVGVGQGKEGEIVDVIGWRLDEVVDLIRGPKQTIVKLEVVSADSQDENQTHVISIRRDKVNLEEQAAQSDVIEIERQGRKFKVGVIDIPTFYADFQAIQRGDPNARRTTQDVQLLLDDMMKKGIDGLVIDLRNNGGGSLGEANALTGLFIKEGPTVQIRYARGGVEVMRDQDPRLVYDGPMLVLVNRMSASASEIFAGAMQDYGRAIVMGGQTFGKGTVQQIRSLEHGQLKLTQAKFYRVSGASTQHKGVIPDITMPSIIDKNEIGEDSLPEALPWDQIKSAEYTKNNTFSAFIDSLQKRHLDRMSDNPLYQTLLEEIEFAARQRNQKTLSLNEKRRIDEKEKREAEQLAILNKKREAEGEKVLKNLDQLEEEQEENSTKKVTYKPDFVAREGGEVLLDLLDLSEQMAAQANQH
ncbi:MAG: carboxy terminal-processing peptidase [Pseudomonadales bacterium]|nr:carboxy terminal-processing peptidase [Pseudomonadales bacterium]